MKNKKSKNIPIESKQAKNSLIIGIVFILLIVIVSYLLGTIQIFNNIFVKKESVVKTEQTVADSECDEKESIHKISDSVVRVIGEQAEGSGFVIRNDGYIATNFHVIKSSKMPRIVFADNTPVIGKLYNWDEQVDIAIIKVERTGLRALSFGDSDGLIQGQVLYTVGFPLGQIIAGEATVTKGTYSAKRTSDIAGVEYIQIDANLNKGNSGSPIIEPCGTVVGILTLSIENAEGLKFAISSKTAKPLTESLIATGPRDISSMIGITSGEEQPLVDTVIQFYNYISTRQFDLAYGLLSKNFKKIAEDTIRLQKAMIQH